MAAGNSRVERIVLAIRLQRLTRVEGHFQLEFHRVEGQPHVSDKNRVWSVQHRLHFDCRRSIAGSVLEGAALRAMAEHFELHRFSFRRT